MASFPPRLPIVSQRFFISKTGIGSLPAIFPSPRECRTFRRHGLFPNSLIFPPNRLVASGIKGPAKSAAKTACDEAISIEPISLSDPSGLSSDRSADSSPRLPQPVMRIRLVFRGGYTAVSALADFIFLPRIDRAFGPIRKSGPDFSDLPISQSLRWWRMYPVNGSAFPLYPRLLLRSYFAASAIRLIYPHLVFQAEL
ncbi:Hypothetical protein NTJ_03715 [Nesidiocoris tenuis]|uniref:Uncharacterized protein n=1 Tax=Nesidiocoris tenuis TaxID=355587 RepID=A0ABN7AKL1_9HEMI|nr:Hypothetical protein NTJ_03715 [Nesidiocoris tenuis]